MSPADGRELLSRVTRIRVRWAYAQVLLGLTGLVLTVLLCVESLNDLRDNEALVNLHGEEVWRLAHLPDAEKQALGLNNVTDQINANSLFASTFASVAVENSNESLVFGSGAVASLLFLANGTVYVVSRRRPNTRSGPTRADVTG
jgi:hypothetical protein